MKCRNYWNLVIGLGMWARDWGKMRSLAVWEELSLQCWMIYRYILPQKWRENAVYARLVLQIPLLCLSGLLELIYWQDVLFGWYVKLLLQEEYEGDDETGKLKCGHLYHLYCIKQWLGQKNTCPVCKTAAVSQT